MSLLGSLLGYDSMGSDLLGYPESAEDACPACGISCYRHTPEMTAECTAELYAQPKSATGERL